MAVEAMSFERFTCDRCGAATDILCGQVERRDKWGHATAQHYQGSQIFAHDYKITLCPDCCTSLTEWHRGGTHG